MLDFSPAIIFFFLPVITTLMLYTLHLHVAVTRTNGRSLETFQKAMLFQNRGAMDRKELPPFLLMSVLEWLTEQSEGVYL
jgi:hypothetical protein